MAHDTVISADGTAIAYEIFGDGPPLIAVCGATAERGLMRSTAQALGEHFRVVNYDRRGRGASGDALPYAVQREIEDLATLIATVGKSAHLYGHSSGAGLVLEAVAAGLPVERFVLHDPPYAPDDQTAQAEARRYGQEVRRLLDEDNRLQAVELFFRLAGVPEEVVVSLREKPMWPQLLALAPTLAYDSAVMGDVERGGAVPHDTAVRALRPGLILVGEKGPPFMLEVAHRLAELLPDGVVSVLAGQDHVADPEVLVPAVTAFLNGQGRA